MKILTIVGARPQFVKAAMVSRAIIEHNDKSLKPVIEEQILHTGQHYDPNMSQIFFDEMRIPQPSCNLAIGSGTHGETTGAMLAGIEKEILKTKPDWLLVYGDTNSTLAGALAAAKLKIPVAHVEAGLRSFNRDMPEEINRVLTDHVSDALLCPTFAALENLKREGIVDGVHHVGDVMYDAALFFGALAEKQSRVLNDFQLEPKRYFLSTVHRAENTDDAVRLTGIMQALDELGSATPVLLPLHPRTRAALARMGMIECADDAVVADSRFPNIRFVPPLSFLDMVMLEKNARAILTDSGGVQKEAYFHGTPCVTLRDETEWVETVAAGWNQLVGADPSRILAAAAQAAPGNESIAEYGAGGAASAIVEILAHRTQPLQPA